LNQTRLHEVNTTDVVLHFYTVRVNIISGILLTTTLLALRGNAIKVNETKNITVVL